MLESSPPVHPQAGRVHTLRALANPVYRQLWLVACLYYLVRIMEMIVVAWLVLGLTEGSALMVAVAGAIRMLPMLGGPIAGSLADRFPKNRIILFAQANNLIVTASITLLIARGGPELWHIFLATLLTGIAHAMDFSARRPFFSEILEERQLVNGLALDGAAHMAALLLGPVLGGLLIAITGFQGTYTVMLVVYILIVVLLLPMRHQGNASTSALAVASTPKIRGSLGVLRSNPVLTGVLAVTVVFNFFGSPCIQMVPVVAQQVLEVESTLYGVLFGALGLGAIMGSLAIATVGIRRTGTAFVLGTAIFSAGLLLFATSTFYPLSFVFLLVAGVGMSAFNVMQTSIVLQATPPEVRGRAMGVVSLGIGISPLGILLVGQLTEMFGPQVAIGLMAGSCLVLVNLLRLVFAVLRDRVT